MQRYGGSTQTLCGIDCKRLSYEDFLTSGCEEDLKEATGLSGLSNGSYNGQKIVATDGIVVRDDTGCCRGSVLIQSAGPIWILHSLFVVDCKRRNRIGKALINKAINEAARDQVQLLLTVFCQLYDPVWLEEFLECQGFQKMPLVETKKVHSVTQT